MSARDIQAQWRDYLDTCSTYGTYADRIHEYRPVGSAMRRSGLADGDLLVDVGAGDCGLDRWLRTEGGWHGQYLPVDGAIQGVNLNDWGPTMPADLHVAVEVVEHVADPWGLMGAMQAVSRRGVVVTTPNADVVDVLALDPTHVSALRPADFTDRGWTVDLLTLNGRGTGDTILASIPGAAR